MSKKKDEITIHSSAAEYLTYVAAVGDDADSMEMRYEDENIWLTQKMMAELYDVSVQNIGQHIKKIYYDGELTQEATIKKLFIVQNEGARQVNREVIHYNLQLTQHTPPSPDDMYRQVKDFYADLAWKGSELNPIELAAWTHAEFVRIHPFPDGNGRTSRLVMNYQLMANGFPAISIAKENRLEYFNALEAYAVQGNLAPFAEMTANLTEHQLDCYLEMAGVEQGMEPSPGM